MAKTLNRNHSLQLLEKMLNRIGRDEPSPTPETFGMGFTVRTEVGKSVFLRLDLDATSAFRECADDHYRWQPPGTPWTLAGIEKLLQRVLAEVFTAVPQQKAEVAKRASARFCDAFFAQPSRFVASVAAYNIGQLEEPTTIGRVTFEACSKHALLNRMNRLWPSSMALDDLARVTEPFALASAETLAHGADAARIAGYRSILDTIDLLNFFGPHVHPLPGATCPIFSSELGMSPDAWYLAAGAERYTFGSWLPTVRPFPLQRFVAALETNETIRRAVALLTRDDLSDCEQAVKTAIVWAGRAAVAERPADSFLKYAICIEALLLPNTRTSEVTYQLRLRAGTLLSATLSGAFDEMEHLYDLRSRIVHNGVTDVPDTSLAISRRFASVLIGEMLQNSELHSMSWREIGAWFESRWGARVKTEGNG